MTSSRFRYVASSLVFTLVWLVLGTTQVRAQDLDAGVLVDAAVSVDGAPPSAFAEPPTARSEVPSALAEPQDAGAPGDVVTPESQPTLSSVVVTAQKREENIQQVPLSITAVDREQVRKLDIRASTDIPKLVPNMSAATSEGRSRPRWFIRGIGINDPSTNGVSPVAVYFDEVYQNFTLAQSFPLFDLERVEVLRGPQGTLWGKNTTGGAVSVISRKPRFETDGYAQFTAGNYKELGFQGAGGGTIIKDKVAARASLFYETRDGWVKNTYNGQRQGDLRDVAGRFQLLIAPVDPLEILLSVHARHNDGQNQATYYVGEKGGPIPSLNGFEEGNRFYTYDFYGPLTDVDNHVGELANVKLDVGPVTFTAISGYDDASRLNTGGTGPLAQNNARTFAHARQFTQELRVAPSKVDRLSWVVGGHYFKEKLFSDAASASLPAIPQPAGYGTYYTSTIYNQKSESVAAFANVSYDFTDWFRLAAGARYTSEKKEIDLNAVNTGARGAASWNNVSNWWARKSVQSPLQQSATQVESNTWSNPSFDVSPSFNLTRDATAYFHYGRGFRGGTYYGGVNAQANVSTVKPETVDAFEVGLKSSWFQNRLRTTVAAFHYEYDDIQVLVNAQTANNTVSATILQNAGSGTVNGAELELDALPVEGLRIHGGLGLLDTKYGGFTAVNNNQVVDASGNEFTRSPHANALIDVEYRVPLPGANAVALGTYWQYSSRFFFNAVDQSNANLQQGKYATGDVRLTFYTPRDAADLQFWMHNVTNSEYRVLATQGTPGVQTRVYGPPRMFGATLTVHY